MTLPRVLFAGPQFPAAAELLAEVLPELAIARLGPRRPRRAERHGAEILVPLMARVDAEFLDAVDGLRLVQQWGAGLEGVDRQAATERGIAVGNVPTALSGSAASVAEWCVLAALGLARDLGALERGIRAGEVWGGPIGRALIGKTAGIVGLGGIGCALACRLGAFEMDLVAVTGNPSRQRPERELLRWLGGPEALGRLLSESDFVFLCLPLDATTVGLIDDGALGQLRQGACLINAGRGALVDEVALGRALDDGRLRAAALDVFTNEPLDPAHPLLGRASVLATPHIAGITDHSYGAIASCFAAIVERLASAQPLEHCVNWEAVGEGFYRGTSS